MRREYTEQHPYGYDRRGGWDIDTSDKTQRESDFGHIPGKYQWEETVDVSSEDESEKENCRKSK